MMLSQSLYAHQRSLARGRVIPKHLRRAINQAAHRQGAAHEAQIRQEMLSRAESLLDDGLIVDDILAGLGLSNA
jgi:hypothetical protein